MLPLNDEIAFSLTEEIEATRKNLALALLSPLSSLCPHSLPCLCLLEFSGLLTQTSSSACALYTSASHLLRNIVLIIVPSPLNLFLDLTFFSTYHLLPISYRVPWVHELTMLANSNLLLLILSLPSHIKVSNSLQVQVLSPHYSDLSAACARGLFLLP